MKLQELEDLSPPGASAPRTLPPWARRELLIASWALFLALATVTAWSTPVAGRLEERLGDRRLLLYRQLLDGNTRDLVMVTIDDGSLQALNLKSPLSRGVYAKVIDRVRRAGARVVGITDVLDGPGPDALGDAALTEVLQGHKDVVLATRIDGSSGKTVLRKLSFPAATGFVDTPVDGGLTRNFWVEAEGSQEFTHCLALELVRRFYADEQFVPRGFAGEPGTRYRIDYACVPGGAFTVASLERALTGKGVSSIFKDRIVLVGSTLPSAENEHRTPVTRGRDAGMSQLEVVAHVTHTLVMDLPMATLSSGAVGGLVFLVVFLGVEVLARSPLPLALAILVFGGAMWTLHATSNLMLQDRLLPLAAPLSALGVAFAGGLLWRISHTAVDLAGWLKERFGNR